MPWKYVGVARQSGFTALAPSRDGFSLKLNNLFRTPLLDHNVSHIVKLVI